MRDLATPRASGPPSTWPISSVAVLCVASAVSAWLGHVQWEPGFGEAALAVTAVTIAVLLVAMVRLAILDWRAEKQSRRAWTAIAGIAELATPPPLEALERSSGDPYAPAPHNPALSRILRAHRHVVPVSLAEPVPSIPSADAGAEPLRSVPQSAPLSAAALLPASHPADNGGADAASAHGDAAERDEILKEVGQSFHSAAPAPAATKVLRQLGPRLATQVRRVANAAWPGSYRAVRVLGVPVEIVSDIVVGQGDKGPSDGGNSPRTRFNGGTAQEGTAGIVGSATPVRSGPHRDLANSHDPTTAAEARRKIVALAEALARQAAREDDAAENAKERSRSPQDTPAEELPSGDAKDDMS